MTCQPPLVNWISDIAITSNHDFNNIPAGSSLNDKVRSVYPEGSIDDLLAYLEGKEFSDYFELRFMFREKPIQQEHVFDFQFTDNAGNVFEAQSQPIIWL